MIATCKNSTTQGNNDFNDDEWDGSDTDDGNNDTQEMEQKLLAIAKNGWLFIIIYNINNYNFDRNNKQIFKRSSYETAIKCTKNRLSKADR